ncbi:MAG: response regulator transcription factor, partial [Caldilineaceae bacterium]|nr:response regulator transcription factor [Caldilineaceae bacterium]
QPYQAHFARRKDRTNRMRPPIRILLIDDQALICQGLRMLLDQYDDMLVIGEAADGQAGVQLARALMPDIILLDLVMPGHTGLDALQAILAHNPRARVLILSAVANQETVLATIQLGASGYLLKSATPAELTNAIRAAHQGGLPLNPQVANILVRTLGQSPATGNAYGQLTTRERQVLRLLAQGRANREIAGELDLAVPTVRAYVCNILKKLQLRNRTQAGLYFLKQQHDENLQRISYS